MGIGKVVMNGGRGWVAAVWRGLAPRAGRVWWLVAVGRCGWAERRKARIAHGWRRPERRGDRLADVWVWKSRSFSFVGAQLTSSHSPPPNSIFHLLDRRRDTSACPPAAPSHPQIEIIQGLPADATITIYRVGPMVDLCSGPHLPSTSYMKVGGAGSEQEGDGGSGMGEGEQGKWKMACGRW